jgi:hypothetical protein
MQPPTLDPKLHGSLAGHLNRIHLRLGEVELWLYHEGILSLTVSLRLLTAEARFRDQVSPCRTCGDKVALGQVFLPVLRFSPVNIIPSLLHIHSFHLGDGQRALRGPFHSVSPHRNNTIQNILSPPLQLNKRIWRVFSFRFYSSILWEHFATS